MATNLQLRKGTIFHVKRIGSLFISITTAMLLLNSCITLTTKKKEITFTSEPSGAAVYRMFDANYTKVDGINNYYIGTTPFKYKAKGAPGAFAFVKDGYFTEFVEPKTKSRLAQYILGNLFWIPYGYIVDLNKIRTYRETQINAILVERPKHNTANGCAPSPGSSRHSGPYRYKAANAAEVIKPVFMMVQKSYQARKFSKSILLRYLWYIVQMIQVRGKVLALLLVLQVLQFLISIILMEWTHGLSKCMAKINFIW